MLSSKRFTIIILTLFLILITGSMFDIPASIQSGFPVLSRTGNTTKYATWNGVTTSGDCVNIDASGNLQATGSACGGGGGSGTVTNTGTLTADLPVIGNGTVDVKVATRSGNTTAFVTTTGTQTSGDCVKIDASGNHIANGSACGSGGGGISSVSSYLNPGGSGNRSGAITITTAGFTSTGNANAWVSGGLPNVVNSYFWSNGQSITSSFTVTFDFGSGVSPIITEATFYQSNSDAQGTWKWQGSTDNASYSDIGSSFALGGAQTQVNTTMSANTTAYRYYRLTGVSGTTSSGPFLYGFIFKLKY